jgi:hypothetical protein
VLVAAGCAFIDARAGVEVIGFPVSAAITDEAIWPPKISESFDARCLVRVGVAKL